MVRGLVERTRSPSCRRRRQRRTPAFTTGQHPNGLVEIGAAETESVQGRFHLGLVLVAAERFEPVLQVAVALERLIVQRFPAIDARVQRFDLDRHGFDLVGALDPLDQRAFAFRGSFLRCSTTTRARRVR